MLRNDLTKILRVSTVLHASKMSEAVVPAGGETGRPIRSGGEHHDKNGDFPDAPTRDCWL